MSDISISLKNINKNFRIYEGRIQKLRGLLRFGREIGGREIKILHDINLHIEQGQTVGIIGLNGAGKTTLLQLIAGILYPTKGSVEVKGRIATVMDIELGFHPEFTGRENIYMQMLIQGIKKKEAGDKIKEIIDFADIGDYIDQPVKIYSAGMHLRLGFSIATNLNTDIILLDEVIAVGDIEFQHKCFWRLKEYRSQGKTLLIVSHNTGDIKRLCDRAILLNEGIVIADNDPKFVVEEYHRLIDLRQKSKASKFVLRKDDFIEKDTLNDKKKKMADLISVDLLDENGNSIRSVTIGQKITLSGELASYSDIPSPDIAFVIRDRFGNDIYGSSLKWEGKEIPPLNKNERLKFSFSFFVNLAVDSYEITVGLIHREDTNNFIIISKLDRAIFFEVSGNQKFYGITNLGILSVEVIFENEKYMKQKPGDRS